MKIQLVLRNPLDTKIDAVPGTAMGNLFADQGGARQEAAIRAKVISKPRAQGFSIEVINGRNRAKKNSALPRESSESEG